MAAQLNLESPGLSERVSTHVLSMPLFAGLNPGAQKLLSRFGRVVDYEKGVDFIQQGEFTSDFHVVLRGSVTGFRRDEDGTLKRLVELSAGEWFGELSALSNQPSPARLSTILPTTVLTLEAGLFKDLYKASRPFRAAIDEAYREQSLGIHLGVVPAFHGLSQRDLHGLRRVASFERLEAGAEIARESSPVESVFLVRAGAVTFHSSGGGKEQGTDRVDGYLMDNSSFGEAGLWEPDAVWSGTYRAHTAVELLVLPIAAIKERFADAPEVMARLAEAAEEVSRADRGEGPQRTSVEGGRLHGDQLHGMLHRDSVKGGEALVINLEKCVRCNACVESCVAVHADGVPRLSKSGFRVAPEANTTSKPISLVTSCYHCQTPGCMMACSYGAIRRDPQGLIRIVEDNCVGCAMCVDACPYDVIRLTDPGGAQAENESMLARIPILGKLLRQADSPKEEPRRGVGFHKPGEVKGRAVKCDRCEGLPFEACVYNCPCGAIERKEPSVLFRVPQGSGRG